MVYGCRNIPNTSYFMSWELPTKNSRVHCKSLTLWSVAMSRKWHICYVGDCLIAEISWKIFEQTFWNTCWMKMSYVYKVEKSSLRQSKWYNMTCLVLWKHWYIINCQNGKGNVQSSGTPMKYIIIYTPKAMTAW